MNILDRKIHRYATLRLLLISVVLTYVNYLLYHDPLVYFADASFNWYWLVMDPETGLTRFFFFIAVPVLAFVTSYDFLKKQFTTESNLLPVSFNSVMSFYIALALLVFFILSIRFFLI